MRRLHLITAFLFLFAAPPALAEDKEPCAAGLVCASDPKTVVEAFRAAGYKAKLAVDNQGDPLIESATAGYQFEAYFYGCNETKRCDSIQFRVAFTKEPENTPELANKWNAKRRYSSMYVLDDGSLVVSWDVSTYGGLSKKNFADVLASWDVVLGGLGTFFDENIPAKPEAKKAG